MTPPRPATRKFPERPVRSGWVGEASAEQPVVGDRLLTVVVSDMRIALAHAQRITRIVRDGGTTLYHLTDQTTITAPQGARITWEEGEP